jgi:hypothetical protein
MTAKELCKYWLICWVMLLSTQRKEPYLFLSTGNRLEYIKDYLKESSNFLYQILAEEFQEKNENNLFKFLDFSKFKDSFHINNGINTDSTKLAGTGLGISQKIAKQLNSKIQFTSIVGSGSKFHLKFHTSWVKESPIFKQFYSKNLNKRAKNQNTEFNKDLSNTVTSLSKYEEATVACRVRKRAYSKDHTIGKYEKVGVKSISNNFSLIDIDKLNKNVSVKSFKIKDFMSDFQNGNNYLSKFAQVTQSECFSDDLIDEYEYEIANETNDDMKVPVFIDNASNVISRMNNTRAKYFSITDISIPIIEKDATNNKFREVSAVKVFKENETFLSKSRNDKIKPKKGTFANKHLYYDLSNGDKNSVKENSIEIDQSFIKNWECPSILIVDDQYINRFIIQHFW